MRRLPENEGAIGGVERIHAQDAPCLVFDDRTAGRSHQTPHHPALAQPTAQPMFRDGRAAGHRLILTD
jgi:hypothetical protein